MHTMEMKKIWLFTPPKKKIRGGNWGKIFTFSQECLTHVHVIQICCSQKKQNCDLDGGWQNTSVFHQPFYLISFGLLRESPKRYELGRDSSVKKERVTFTSLLYSSDASTCHISRAGSESSLLLPHT